MKIGQIFIFVAATALSLQACAQYNQLWIPPKLEGSEFFLVAQDTFKQMLPGQQTITASFSGQANGVVARTNFLGPTMFWKKGETVKLHVTNKLQEETTVHWHGMHLPAVMDGGPHQVIKQGDTWSPYFEVKNNAATYWYHPHLHEMTEEQIIQGLTGLIIIQDEIESQLPLPRTYGVDDIPIILTDRRFDEDNQFIFSHYGDDPTVNGTLDAAYTLPAQIVRIRFLNAATERSYNLGFSDNREFHIITTDAGLIEKPVTTTRHVLSAGERIEILVDLTGAKGQSLDLVAFNASMGRDLPGSEPSNVSAVPDFIRNELGAIDFNLVHFTIGDATADAQTNIPTTLTTNIFPNEAEASAVRRIEFEDLADSSLGEEACGTRTGCSWFNEQFFDMNRIDYRVRLGDTEIWELTNNSLLAHPFHIHDVSFLILDRDGSPVDDAEKGWKDVVLVNSESTVRFIAKFATDYADPTTPYMYHCHINFHEDAGMMGQFVVGEESDGEIILSASENEDDTDTVELYPVPTSGFVFVKIARGGLISSIEVTDDASKLLLKVPYHTNEAGLDLGELKSGVYIMRIKDELGKTYTRKLIKL